MLKTGNHHSVSTNMRIGYVMVLLIIDGRTQVVEAAARAIEQIEEQISGILPARESGINVGIFFMPILAGLTTVVKEKSAIPNLLIRNVDRLKKTHGMIDVLNHILSKNLPIDAHNIPEEIEKTSEYSPIFISLCMDLAIWFHIRKATWVTKIVVEGTHVSDASLDSPEMSDL